MYSSTLSGFIPDRVNFSPVVVSKVTMKVPKSVNNNNRICVDVCMYIHLFTQSLTY